MADPVEASDTTVDNADVAYLFTQTSADAFRKTNQVPVAVGGTGATTASAARTSLGLAIGTNVQAYDANLTTWAGKTAPSGTPVGTTDTQTMSNKKFVDSSVSFVDDSDNTKQVKVQVSGVSTGTIRTYAGPDKDGTIALTRDVGLYLIEKRDFSSASSIAFTNLPATDCDEILFVFPLITEASGFSSIQIQTSKTNGAAWINYFGYSQSTIKFGSSVALAGAAIKDQTYWELGLAGGTGREFAGAGEFRLFTPTASRTVGANQIAARAAWNFYGSDNTNQMVVHGNGDLLTSDADLTRPNAIRFVGSSLTGTIEVYGLRNAT